MRVVAGRLGGRRIRPVSGTGTRPMTDRVREALFGILGPAIPGARVLDLYAGTGALAIEALSRGARTAVLVEPSAGAVAVIRENLRALDLDQVAVVRRTRAEVYLRPGGRGARDGPFDLVLVDPPWAGAWGGVLAVLAAVRAVLAPGATVALEAPARREGPVWPPGLEPAAPRRHGDAVLHLARYAGAGGPGGPPSGEHGAVQSG